MGCLNYPGHRHRPKATFDSINTAFYLLLIASSVSDDVLSSIWPISVLIFSQVSCGSRFGPVLLKGGPDYCRWIWIWMQQLF